MEPNTTPQPDTPAPPAPQAPSEPTNEPKNEPESTQAAAPDEQPSDDSQAAPAAPAGTPPAEPEEPPAEEEDDSQPYRPVPPTPPIDFSQLAADENGLIDPNQLAGAINQRIAQAEQNASARAQQIYAEQEAEKGLWDKAYDKYPDLKTDKELRHLVHQARIGEATDLLSRSNDPNSVKLPTPSQVAQKLFNRIGTAKTQGMAQANTNTQIQKSAVLETAGRATNEGAESVQQARANLNNPNKEVATKARSELLRKYLGWDT